MNSQSKSLFRMGVSLGTAVLLLFVLLLALNPAVQAAPDSPQAPFANDLRISQVYGGGGNSGATYTHDFIELFNSGSTTIDLTGWSVQYASATGTSWNVTNLNGSVGPGQYYLIQQAQGAGGTTPLPTPDANGNAAMSGTVGKVALVNNTTALTTGCPTESSIIDFVGFGATASCYEGSGPTPAPSNTTAAIRNENGCTDTDNNAADFTVGAPTPRNTSSPTNLCVAQPQLTLSKSVSPDTGVVPQALVTYELVAANIGAADDSLVTLTDTLPVEVAFASWLEQPAGATVLGNELTWSGAISANTSVTFTFVVTNLVDSGEVTNQATAVGTANSQTASASYLALPPFTATDAFTVETLGRFVGSGSEIATHDPVSQTLYVVTGGSFMEILDISDPTSPTLKYTIPVSAYGAGANSVAIYDGVVAAAVQNITKTLPGEVVFFNRDGNYLGQVTVGALPDMLTYTPDGQYILVANEGEPDGADDPEGSVSVIDMSNGVAGASVTTLGFTHFTTDTIHPDVRLFPGKTVAQDVEPEYITVAPDGLTAWVALQEANAFAVVDMTTMTITQILPLGFKDHSLPGNALDASDRDVDGTSGGGGRINIQNWPVFGMYMPDAITSYEVDGEVYIISANEGDARDEDQRIGHSSIALDPTVFPNAATLKLAQNLGRLDMSTIDGLNEAGQYEKLYVYGARSFSIWRGVTGEQVYDSGSDFEELTALWMPDYFNSSVGEKANFDTRSDNKGPEPEGVDQGVINGRVYAFVGLERTGGVVIYDVTDPMAPFFADYIMPVDLDNNDINDDFAPEGILFIEAADSPTGYPLLVVAHEGSFSTVIYQFTVDADVQVAKDGPAQAPIGEEIVYTVTITNAATAVADDLIFTDTLPANTSYVSDNSGITPSNPSPGVYVWDLGDFPPATTASVNITLSVGFGANPGDLLVNTAVVSTTSPGDDPSDNTATSSATAIISAASCGQPATLISAVQGSGASSPLLGQNVTVEAVVVSNFQGGSGTLNGFHIQEEADDHDNDPLTSEGLFIYNNTTNIPVTVGDLVRVQGTVGEFNSGTQLANVTATVVCSSGNVITPTLITLPLAEGVTWERYEGMLLQFEDLVATDNFRLGRFGQVRMATHRLAQPTNVVAPGADAIALQALNNRSYITLDDARTFQNMDPMIYPAPELSYTNTLRGGDVVTQMIGVVDHFTGSNGGDPYRLQPTQPVNFVATNLRQDSPPDVGGTIQVASFNVLNYFSTLDDGVNDICGPLANQECRGADSALEFERQYTKIVNAIVEIDAAVVGLMEIENHADDEAVIDLITRLNIVAGGVYTYVDTGVIGTDAIKQAIIYQPALVTPVGDYAILDSSDDPRFDAGLNRPVIIQTFVENSSGERFTVAVNHLKSKGSNCDDVGDPDIGDGQGNCNVTRTEAAEALVDYLAAPDNDFSPYTLIIGDLNAYALEDPIMAIQHAGYTNLVSQFGGVDAYGYQFGGQWGYLDHALANNDLLPFVTGTSEWHINADEPIALDYNTEFKSARHIDLFFGPSAFRSSDHDPVIVGLSFASAVTPTITILSPTAGEVFTSTNGTAVSVSIIITTTDFIIPADGHWHLWLDGVDQGPVMGYTTTVSLMPGTHVITAELNSPSHVSLGISDSVTVTVNVEYFLYLPVIMKP